MARKGSLNADGSWPNPTDIIPEFAAKIRNIHALPVHHFLTRAKDDDKQASSIRVPMDLHEIVTILVADPRTPYRYNGHFARDAMWHRAVELGHVMELDNLPAWREAMAHTQAIAKIEWANYRAAQHKSLIEELDSIFNNIDSYGPSDLRVVVQTLAEAIQAMSEDRRPELEKRLKRIKAAMKGRGWLLEAVEEDE